MSFCQVLWCFFEDDAGFLLATESLLLGTVGVIGSLVGLAEVRNAVVQELGDFSQAVAILSQDYSFTSVVSSNVASDIETAGSLYDDLEDDQIIATSAANGILVLDPGDSDE